MKEKEESLVIIRSFFSDASGVVDDLIGKECDCYVAEVDDYFGIMAHIMSALSQRQDIKVEF